MPISFTIDRSARRIRTRIEGAIFDSDPVEYLRELLAHPDYRPGMSGLVECRDVHLGSVSTPAIRRLADFSRESESLLKNSCVAIVAPQRAVFGVVRMYQFLRDPPYDLSVFRDLASAEEWLDEVAGSGGASSPATIDPGEEEDA
ncbi:MAG: hypothetical protein QNK05_16865 [Myxococcota bacterium]|nr:hypothetical protein [Myxococcota bacterium]